MFLSTTRPHNTLDYQLFSPGPVGQLGDTLGMIKYKHSYPDQGIRWDPEYTGLKQNRLGSNISDGTHLQYTTGGYG